MARDEQSRRDQLIHHRQLSEQNLDLREAHMKSLNEVEELKRFQELRIDEFSRRRLIENQDTINEFAARIQELQNEVNCLNDARDFEDAESARSGLSDVPSQPALLPPFRDPGGMPSRSVISRQILEFAWYIGKRFCKSTGVFFITIQDDSIRGFPCRNTHHLMKRVNAKHQTQP